MSMLRYIALSDSSRNECILIIEQYSRDSLFQASAQISHDSFITLLLQSDIALQYLSLVSNIIFFILWGLFI